MHPFFDFFRKDRPFVNLDPSKWPPEWSVVRYKMYQRYPRIVLPQPRLDKEFSLSDAFFQRQTNRDFQGSPLSLSELSNLLYFSCGVTRPKEMKRVQPSGGGLYPIELYLGILQGSGELGRGVYHYNVLEHCLEKLPARDLGLLDHLSVYPWVCDAAALLLYSFIEERTKPKYGNFSYKVGLIEAGHIGQNVYLNCAAMDLKCCSLGGVNEENAHALLDIDGISEVVFYGMAIGK